MKRTQSKLLSIKSEWDVLEVFHSFLNGRCGDLWKKKHGGQQLREVSLKKEKVNNLLTYKMHM